jgi:hypothetical protein
MAQQVLVSMVDDLDGSDADAGTVRFGLDGRSLEIDLSVANAARLRSAFAPFVAAGCRVGRASARVDRASQRSADSGTERRPDGSAIRQWANEHGYEVGVVGRIPAEVVAAYDVRDQAPPAAPDEAPQPVPATGRGEVDPLAYSAEVRQWAAANGHQVAKKGRIPAGVVAAYRAAAGGKRSGRRRTAPAPTFTG